MPFELLESKLTPPRLGDAGVARTALLARLDASVQTPIVVICAGPGYGKTTALAQWIGSERRPVAWVSVDRDHSDPVVLLAYVAVALHRVAPIDDGVFEALSSPGASIETRVVPRLGAALAGAGDVVLILDDVHAIANQRSVDALVTLAGHLAPGSQLVLCTRDTSRLPLGLLRARRLTVELGPDDLRMEATEARDLFTAAGHEVSDDELAELVGSTEGWPAALYLAARSADVTRSGPARRPRITGNDRLLTEFLGPELLVSLAPEDLRFLAMTSPLEQLSGPLCDAVLQSTGAAALLESLTASNRFVVGLDRERSWYRCHHLVREHLAAELARSEPELLSQVLTRASDWCAANGHPLAGIRYAQADDDPDRVAALAQRQMQSMFQTGRSDTVKQWLAWLLEHGDPQRYPAVAVLAAIFFSADGQATESDRWAALAETGTHSGPLPDGSASIDSWRALQRAQRARRGVAALWEDASEAVATLAPGSPWHPVALLCLARAHLLVGRTDEADDAFADAAEESRLRATANAVPIVVLTATAERALIAAQRGEWVRAQELAEQALAAARRSRLQESPLIALVYAVAAHVALHHGRTDNAREWVTDAQRRLPQLTYASPIPSIQTRLELARCYLALADPTGARTMLREVDAILRRCPDLGTLSAEATELRTRLDTVAHDAPGVSSLTSAELRVLPLLTTHLTFKEIGERLYISRHTVKSHAMSIYRKLNVASRSDAVERAHSLGLL